MWGHRGKLLGDQTLTVKTQILFYIQITYKNVFKISFHFKNLHLKMTDLSNGCGLSQTNGAPIQRPYPRKDFDSSSKDLKKISICVLNQNNTSSMFFFFIPCHNRHFGLIDLLQSSSCQTNITVPQYFNTPFSVFDRSVKSKMTLWR